MPYRSFLCICYATELPNYFSFSAVRRIIVQSYVGYSSEKDSAVCGLSGDKGSFFFLRVTVKILNIGTCMSEQTV